MAGKFDDLKTTPKEVHKFNLFFYIPVLTLTCFVSAILNFVGENVGGGIVLLLFAALFCVCFCFSLLGKDAFAGNLLMLIAHSLLVLFSLFTLFTGNGAEPITLAVSAYLVVYYAMRLAALPKSGAESRGKEENEGSAEDRKND